MSRLAALLIFMVGGYASAAFEPNKYDADVRTRFADVFAVEKMRQENEPPQPVASAVRLLTNPTKLATNYGLLTAGVSIDHVWIAHGKATGFNQAETVKRNFLLPSFKMLQEEARVRLTEVSAGPFQFQALLLGKTVSVLVSGQSLELPSLIIGASIYRAQELCLSDDAVHCREPLKNALDFPLKDEESITGTLFPKSSEGPKIWNDRFAVVQPFVLVTYVRIATTEKIAIRTLPGVIHPGYGAQILALQKILYDKYLELFGIAAAKTSDFVARALIADCDTNAATVIEINPALELGMAIGNMPTGTGLVDPFTQNHAWNFAYSEGSHKLSSFDLTPAKSSLLEFALSEEAFRKIIDRVQNLTKENFYVESLFERGKTAELPKSFGTKYFDATEIVADHIDLNKFELEYPRYDRETNRKTDYRVSADQPGASWANLFVNDQSSVALTVKTHVYPGKRGELIFPSFRDEEASRDRIQFSDLIPKHPAGESLFYLNVDLASLANRTSKHQTLEYQLKRFSLRRGYAWPKIPESDLLKIWPRFAAQFPQVKQFDVVDDPNDKQAYVCHPNGNKGGPADVSGMGYGVLIVQRGDRAYFNPATANLVRQHFTDTEKLVRFWRDQGYRVIPTVRHEWHTIFYRE